MAQYLDNSTQTDAYRDGLKDGATWDLDRGAVVSAYTTWGSVRGCCGHEHTTIAAAERCAARDSRDCARARGYSDRSVYAVGTCPLRDEDGSLSWWQGSPCRLEPLPDACEEQS